MGQTCLCINSKTQINSSWEFDGIWILLPAPRIHGTLNNISSLSRPLNVKMLKDSLRRTSGGLIGIYHYCTIIYDLYLTVMVGQFSIIPKADCTTVISCTQWFPGWMCQCWLSQGQPLVPLMFSMVADIPTKGAGHVCERAVHFVLIRGCHSSCNPTQSVCTSTDAHQMKQFLRAVQRNPSRDVTAVVTA